MPLAVRLLALTFIAVTWAGPAANQQLDWKTGADARTFRSWTAHCDADRFCFAEARPTEGSPAAIRLRLMRRQDDAAWNLVLAAQDARPAFPYDIYADVDGASVAFNTRGAAAAYDHPSDLYLLGAAAQQLFDWMAPGSRLGFEFLDGRGNLHAPQFSLVGLSAALLWIDERQGRVGAPRRAGEAPRGLTPVDNAGGPPTTVPRALLELHGRQDDCDPLTDLPHNTLFQVAELAPGDQLYFVPCSGGAYNAGFAVYRGDGRSFARMRFADYSDRASWSVTSQLVNPEWNSQTRTLTTFDKGRGIADCGSIGEWRLRDGQLRLERFRHKAACDGHGDPGDFPIVYQAKPLPPH